MFIQRECGLNRPGTALYLAPAYDVLNFSPNPGVLAANRRKAALIDLIITTSGC